jgi:hypothetical protein
VYALTVHDGELIVGGSFLSAGGVPASDIARWNGLTWQPMGSGVGGYTRWVSALTVHNSELIAGGHFLTAGGQVSAYWARWGTGPQADLDCDLEVDGDDYDLFSACVSGPGAGHDGSPLCLAADFDDDDDVDQADFGVFQRCLSGPGVVGDPNCAD